MHGTTRPPAFTRGRTRDRRAVGLVIPCRVASPQSPAPFHQARDSITAIGAARPDRAAGRPHGRIDPACNAYASPAPRAGHARKETRAGDQPRSVVGSADHLPRRGLAARVSEPSNEVSRDPAERPGAISHEADSTGRRTRAATSCATAWSYAGDHPRRAEGPDRQRLHPIRTRSASGEKGRSAGRRTHHSSHHATATGSHNGIPGNGRLDCGVTATASDRR
jgi:hypothetical protein